MQWHGETLRGPKLMYCPPGTAHGFVALEPDSVIYYKCTAPYDKESDGGIFPFDEWLKPHWPIAMEQAIMSDKDMTAPSLEEWLADPRGVWNE